MNTNETLVCLHHETDGQVDGVLVKTVDESFVVALNDADNGNLMSWNKAMEKHSGVLPSKKQALIICAYIDEINDLLEQAGGEKLDRWYWTKAEYSSYIAWFYYGSSGCFINDNKYTSHGVRPVLASA